MIYRIHKLDPEGGSSQGYEYCGSLRELRRRLAELEREGYTLEHDAGMAGERPTPRSKREVIALLNFWADHPDNG